MANFQYPYCFCWTLLLFIPTVLYLLLDSNKKPPVDFCEHMNASKSCESFVKIHASPLISQESLFPYTYNKLDFCDAENDPWAFMFADQILEEKNHILPYKISFLKDETCITQCQKTYKLDQEEDSAKLCSLKNVILKNYQHHWSVDDMPVVRGYLNARYVTLMRYKNFSTQFPVGYYRTWHETLDDYYDNSSQLSGLYLFNHIDLEIKYQSINHESLDAGSEYKMGRIVQVKIQPRSIRHQKGKECDEDLPPLRIPNELDLDGEFVINYTFSVRFVEDRNIEWASRFDSLFSGIPEMSHQTSRLLLSFVVLLVVISQAFLALRNAMPGVFRRKEESVNIDPDGLVFSSKLLWPPRNPLLLSLLFGIGVQIVLTAFIMFGYLSFGFFSPYNKEEFWTFTETLFAYLGAPASFLSLTLYKVFEGKKQGLPIFLTVTLCPCFIAISFSTMNFVVWNESLSLMNWLQYICYHWFFWSVVTVPLHFMGTCALLIKEKSGDTDVVNSAEYEIRVSTPCCSVGKSPFLRIIASGVAPFVCIAYVLESIHNTIWLDHVYYMYDYLFLDFMFLMLACSGMTLVLCFKFIQHRDYHWWLHSFFAALATSIYVFAYSVYYFFTGLKTTDSTSLFIYLGYTLIIVAILFLALGCVGFLTCYCFVKALYNLARSNQKDQSDEEPPPPYESVVQSQ